MGQQERVEAESVGVAGMGPLKRRGLIAGLAALAAAGLAKLAGPERAEAGHDTTTVYNPVQVMHLGVINDGGAATNNETSTSVISPTRLVASTTDSAGAFRVVNIASGDSIQGHAQGNNNAGLSGRNDDAVGLGVHGHSTNGTGVLGFSTLGTGVHGDSSSSGIGVEGTSLSNVGVRGRNFASNTANPGVQGISTAGFGVHGSSANNVGVLGLATGASNPSPGIYGSATQGYGVFGFSANSNGIAGQSGTSAAGCVGFAGAPGGYGIYGGIAVQGGYAGGFAGPVLVVGDFTATGGAKSAAVPHPDGTHRRLYCLESPESLFEDFGAAKLVNGRAQVTFDPDFVAVVHNDKYLVFPVPEGDCKGLYVSDKSPTGFEVRELQGGASTLAFSYRVVAKRKDIPGPRLEKVKLPQPIKELVKPPEPPTIPERPDSRPPARSG